MLEMMFSFQGRISRLQYFLRGMMLGFVLLSLVVVAVVALLGNGGLEALKSGAPPPSMGSLGLIGLLLILAIPAALWSSFSLQARRFRDIGWNPLYVILGWIGAGVVDRLVAMAAPSLALPPTHETTLFGLLLNLGLGGALLFWPSGPERDAFDIEPPEDRPDPEADFRAKFRAKPAPAPVRDPTPARAMAPVQGAAPATSFGRRGL